jgi:transposase
MRRHGLSDLQWKRISKYFPDLRHEGGAGHPWKDHRLMLDGVLWRLHTGAPWRDLPERFGPWKTVYERFRRWRMDGTWARILHALRMRLEKSGRVGRKLWLVDATVVRASRSAAGAEKKIACPARVGRA